MQRRLIVTFSLHVTDFMYVDTLGRDGTIAHCILYASFGDTFRQSTMVFTEQTGLEKLYNMVAYAFDLSKYEMINELEIFTILTC